MVDIGGVAFFGSMAVGAGYLCGALLGYSHGLRKAVREQATSSRDALLDDARRYRWLRTRPAFLCWLSCGLGTSTPDSDIDSAITKEMAKGLLQQPQTPESAPRGHPWWSPTIIKGGKP